MTTQAFDARVTALFYHLLPASVCPAVAEQVDNYISKLSSVTFLNKIEKIHQYIFIINKQLFKTSKFINHEFSAHVKFLQQMKTYKTLKYIIKHADLSFIQHVLI